MGYELVKAEAEKGARSKNPDAIDLAMRGRASCYQQGRNATKDNNNAARALFEQALEIDPNDADALAGEASDLLHRVCLRWNNPETDYDAKVLGQADRAIALAPDNVRAYSAKSSYLSFRAALMRPPRRRRRTRHQSEFASLYDVAKQRRKLPLADSNRRRPTCNKQCG